MHTHETHVLLYTIVLITSLLVLLMMLWHISTAHLIDNYNMPQEWYAEFINAQFPGWRIGLWVLLFFMITLNCIHALLCLDFYAGRVYPRGRSSQAPNSAPTTSSVSQTDGAGTTDPRTATLATGRQVRSTSAQQRHSSLTSHASTSAHLQPTDQGPGPSPSKSRTPSHSVLKLPSTPHPFLSPDLPSYFCFLPSLYDVVIILLLLFHIVLFLTSLHSNMKYCDWTSKDGVAMPWDWMFDDRGSARGKRGKETVATTSSMSLYDRCVRINIDNRISGGFDIGLCLVLLALHVLILALRLWEWVSRRNVPDTERAGNGEEGIEMEDLEHKTGDRDVESARVWSTDGMVEEHARAERRESATGASTAPLTHTNAAPEIPHRDQRGSRKTGCSGASERTGQLWMLLECLVGDG